MIREGTKRKRIKKLMIDRGLRVSDVAREVGYSVQYVSNYLTGYKSTKKLDEKMWGWYNETRERRRKENGDK